MRLTKRGRMYAKLEAKGWLICHVDRRLWTIVSPEGVHIGTGRTRKSAEWKAIQSAAMSDKKELAQQVQDLERGLGMYS